MTLDIPTLHFPRNADDPCRRHPTPIATVVGLSTIVPHQEPVSRRDLDWGGEITLRRIAARGRIAIMLPYELARAVGPTVDMTCTHIDFIAGTRNDALYEVRIRLCR